MFKPTHIVAGLAGLIALCACTYVQAKPQAWEGYIGSAPIVMELEIDSTSNEVVGRYFYRKYSADIWLKGGKTEDGKLYLTEYEDWRSLRDERESERIDITLRPKGKGWQGQWQGEKAKKALAVTLKPLNTGTLTMPNINDPTPYNFARLAGLHLKAVRKQKFMGYTLEWMEEPISKCQMIRVRDGFPDETLYRINSALEEKQFSNIDLYFNRHSMDPRFPIDDNYRQTVTPSFLNTHLLSVSVDWSFLNLHINLNIENGEDLKLEDLLWLKKGKPTLRYKPDGEWDEEEKHYEYRKEVLAPWLVQTMTRPYPREMEFDTKNEGECNYTDAEIWEFPSWYLTPKGIHLRPSFVESVVRGCRYPEWHILPWSVVKKHPGILKGKLP